MQSYCEFTFREHAQKSAARLCEWLHLSRAINKQSCFSLGLLAGLLSSVCFTLCISSNVLIGCHYRFCVRQDEYVQLPVEITL